MSVLNKPGVKLDNKGCEALEEIFRRVRTKTLDVENTNLEDDVRITHTLLKIIKIIIVIIIQLLYMGQ